MEPSPQWPRRPPPEPEESFASWFTRLAWVNGLSPPELFGAALAGGRMFRIDLDRFADPLLIGVLADRTGVPRHEIGRRTLRAWCGKLYEEDDGQMKLLWLPPAGTSLSRRSFGQQMCPECLATDPTPHLRRTWRLSFVTCCPDHARLLADRCYACGEPLQPLYLGASRHHLACCWHCGADLRRAPADPVAPADQAVQEWLLAGVRDEWLSLGRAGPVRSLAAFKVLWILYRLLATGRFAEPLRRSLSDRSLHDLPPASIPRIKEVERLNPRQRLALLRMVMALVEDWPERFVAVCGDVGIASRVLVKEAAVTPYALWVVATQRLAEPPREVSEAEIAAAKDVLQRRGVLPTYRALTELLGVKVAPGRAAAVPAVLAKPYGTDRYWKLDGVSPAVRAAAKRAAKRHGENVGPWVDQALRQLLEREKLL